MRAKVREPLYFSWGPTMCQALGWAVCMIKTSFWDIIFILFPITYMSPAPPVMQIHPFLWCPNKITQDTITHDCVNPNILSSILKDTQAGCPHILTFPCSPDVHWSPLLQSKVLDSFLLLKALALCPLTGLRKHHAHLQVGQTCSENS